MNVEYALQHAALDDQGRELVEVASADLQRGTAATAALQIYRPHQTL